MGTNASIGGLVDAFGGGGLNYNDISDAYYDYYEGRALTDDDIFNTILDHWISGKGKPFIRYGGSWANYFQAYPGFKDWARQDLLFKARAICKAAYAKPSGSYSIQRQMIVNRGLTRYVLNGVTYHVQGKYNANCCQNIIMYNNLHFVTDIADPDGWKDSLISLATALFQPPFDSPDQDSFFLPFRIEVGWMVPQYRFEIIDCKTCRINETTGNWPFN